jgi:hypothetical protein
MKRGIFLALVGLVFSAVAIGQTATTNGNGSGKSSTSVSKENGVINIASGTEIAGELQNTLNVEKAKVGDQVVLKTKKAVKQNGEVVIEKGAKLIGKVTEVKERAKGEATSQIGVLFDTLKQGDVMMPVQASIVSVVNVAARGAVANNDVWADSNTSASGSARTSSTSSGGLLGGVTQTAGGVVNTTTSTVGGVANTATNTVGGVANTAGSTVGSTAGTLGRVHVLQSTDASASGGSTLALTGGNLKLEKGTTFNVALSSSANAGN